MTDMDKLIAKLQGQKDSRGLTGIMARGSNVYKAGVSRAQSGGGSQYGRPSKEAIQRRLRKLNG
jgi:hypothetical protein